MNKVDFSTIISSMKGQMVDRPNKATAGTLSGHAAGEPFEKIVYRKLKEEYADKIYKQYEYLNDIYLRNPKHITAAQRYALLDSPTALFLLSRSNKATKEWSPDHIFEEKQNDTADILYYNNGYYDIIDVKTRNTSKIAMPPNIISAYKLAKTCAIMIDNNEYNKINIDYIEIDWEENGEYLRCTNAYHGNLFKTNPESLYINWAAAMQIQFHVSELEQLWNGSREEWAKDYIRAFVRSAENRCQSMRKKYVIPFLRYIE